MLTNLFVWPLQLPAVVLLAAFTFGSGVLLLMLRASEDNLFLLNLALLLVFFYVLVSTLALLGQRALHRTAGGLLVERSPGEADLNPFQSLLAFKLGLLLAAVVIVTYFFRSEIWLVGAMALLLPLPYLSAALEESLFAGLTPAYAGHLLKGLGPSYLIVALLLSGSAFALAYALLLDQRLLVLGLSGYAFLLAHGLVGWLLYAHRGRLDLDTEQSPEQTRGAEQLAEARALDRLMEELHRLTATGRLRAANDRIEAFLSERVDELDPLLHERLRSAQDPRLFLEHGVHYLQRLAERGELRKAWAVCKDCLEQDEQFRPLSDGVLMDLTRVAGKEDARLVEQLLGDFGRAYPESELASQAAFRRARVKIELLGEGSAGIELLRELAERDRAFAAGEEFRRYLARLRPKR